MIGIVNYRGEILYCFSCSVSPSSSENIIQIQIVASVTNDANDESGYDVIHNHVRPT